MVKANKAANAVATVTGAAYLVCTALAALAPSLIFSISRSWFHMFRMDANALGGRAGGGFFLGFVSSVIAAWFFAYAVVAVYNRLESK